MSEATKTTTLQEPEIQTILEGSGLPVAYRMFPEGGSPDLPFVVWYVGSERNFPADGDNYFNIKQITVELYTRLKDTVSESAVEAVLPGIWDKTEIYLDDENCYQIVYNLEV